MSVDTMTTWEAFKRLKSVIESAGIEAAVPIFGTGLAASTLHRTFQFDLPDTEFASGGRGSPGTFIKHNDYVHIVIYHDLDSRAHEEVIQMAFADAEAVVAAILSGRSTYGWTRPAGGGISRRVVASTIQQRISLRMSYEVGIPELDDDDSATSPEDT